MIANGVYGSNLSSRIQKGYEAIQNFDPQAKQILKQYYGVDTNHLLTYALSPQHGIDQITKQNQAAMIATEANLSGFNGIDQKTAEALSSQMTDSNYSMDYFRTNFQKAAQYQPLEQEQVGQRGQATISQGQALSTAFSGLNQMYGSTPAQDAAAVRMAQEARVAGLSGGGGYATSAKGAVGVGRAGSTGVGSA
jgi:hypothetical protein